MISLLTIEDVPKTLASQPIEWFLAHHRRHRQVSQLIDDLADAPDFEEGAMRFVLAFIADEAPQHLADEEEQLFPALRRRCEASDTVDPVLRQLLREHRLDAAEASTVTKALLACLASGEPPSRSPETRALLRRYASHERQHLALENAVVLPFARLRLNNQDLAAIADGIVRRRGYGLRSKASA
jgi:hemerythrin-like domain-containing protein